MGKQIQFDYYYGIEAEQFSFYRVPRLLIKDERFKGLSSDAKLLYGLMLDRMSLSMKNGWLDEENRAYIIYTVDAIMEDLGCAKATCVKIMKELDLEKGIGLIEKKRRGLGKPDIIYVKNFATMSEETAEKMLQNNDKSTEVQNLNFKKSNNDTSRSSETELQEVQNVNLQKYNKQTFGGSEIEPTEVQKLVPNYTNYNQTILNNVYMDLRWKKPVFKRTKTAMERNNIFATIRRYVKKLKPQYNGDAYLETVRCYFDISQENLEKCRYTYQGNETYAFLMSDKYIMALYTHCLVARKEVAMQGMKIEGFTEKEYGMVRLEKVGDVLFQALILDNVSCQEKYMYAEFISIYCVEGG